MFFFFFFKQKTAYEVCGRDWSSDVCSSDLNPLAQTLLAQTKSVFQSAGIRAKVSLREQRRICADTARVKIEPCGSKDDKAAAKMQRQKADRDRIKRGRRLAPKERQRHACHCVNTQHIVAGQNDGMRKAYTEKHRHSGHVRAPGPFALFIQENKTPRAKEHRKPSTKFVFNKDKAGQPDQSICCAIRSVGDGVVVRLKRQREDVDVHPRNADHCDPAHGVELRYTIA